MTAVTGANIWTLPQRVGEKTVRWGVIGCGQIAVDKSIPGLLAAHNSGARLVAVSDPLPERCERARQLAAAQPGDDNRLATYSDAAELLTDPDVDAVYIALPTGLHAPVVLAAVEAGKAILCEKPLGRDAAEVRTMARAAAVAGIPLMTAYMSRFGDTFVEARRLLSDGAIGTVTMVYANFSYPALAPYPPESPGGWRWTDPKGGGPLLDIGIYLAFGLRELLGGDSVERVGTFQCDAGPVPPNVPNRDTTVAWFKTQKGVPGLFAATFSHEESRLVFYGTHGRLELEKCFSQRPTGRLELQTGGHHLVMETMPGDRLPHYDNYRREFEHFTHALIEGTPYQPSAEEALTDALLLDALRGEENE